MPTFLQMALILACSMFGFIPYLALLFYPFRNHMLLKGYPAALLTLPLSAGMLYCDVSGALGMPVLTVPVTLVCAAAFLALALLNIWVPIWKNLLNTFSVINFFLLIRTVASHMAESYSLRWLTVTVILQALLLIPYGINLAVCLGPTLNLSDAKVWKFLWAAPAAVTVLGCGLIFAGVASGTCLTVLAVTVVAAAVAAGVTLYLTKTEMITLIFRKQRAEKPAEAAPAAVAQMTDPVQLQYENLHTRMAESRQTNQEMLMQVVAMEDDLQQQNYEMLAQRLNFLRKQMTATAKPTGNGAIDAVLTYYTRQALLSSIKIVSSVSLPEYCGVSDEELTVLISCLLDNALNACREQTAGTRRIAIATFQKEDVLQIGVKNTFSGQMAEDSEELEICRTVAERYEGALQFKSGDGVAQTVITLNI
jgi:hypothetical protein